MTTLHGTIGALVSSSLALHADALDSWRGISPVFRVQLGAPSHSTVLTLDAFNGRITPTSTAATLRMRDFSLLY